jgi:hypothetical protein
VVLYLWKHRERFIQQVLTLHRSTYGRWFLLGLGLFVGAQVIENAANLLPGSGVSPFSDVQEPDEVPGRLSYQFLRSLDEPLECVGAAALWLSALTLWLRHRGGSTP